MITKKAAHEIIGGLTRTSKMPGKSYGLPAWECKTGSKLAKIPGSVCHGCYAMKGNYTRYPAIKAAQYKRLNTIQRAQWVVGMAAAIGKDEYFRWHDAGDLQSIEHLKKIFRVCELTPKTKHWMPTREASILKEIMPEDVPSNLIIRMSSHMIDQGPVKFWPWTSTVVTKKPKCPAPKQGGKCKDCRACWDKRVKNVSYGKH